MQIAAGSSAAAAVSAGVGWAWIPYVVAGAVMIAVAAVVRFRSRTDREVGWAEFLVVRGVFLLAIGVIVSLLADAAAEGDGLTAVDRPIWAWSVAHRTDWITAVARVVTDVGGTVVMGALAGAAALWLWWARRRRGAAALVAAVTAGAAVAVAVSKPIVGRTRPPVEYRLISETNESFPSGHALVSVAVLGVLVIVLGPELRSERWRRSLIVAAVAAAVLIGASRLYLGVHWATDIAGGWLTGAGWLLVCLTAYQWWLRYPTGWEAVSGARPRPPAAVGTAAAATLLTDESPRP